MQGAFLPAWARALRHIAALAFLATIVTLMLVACSRDFNLRNRTTMTLSERALFETFASRTRSPSLTRHTLRTQQTRLTVDVETQNLTFVLQNLQFHSELHDDPPWMYTTQGDPFAQCDDGCPSTYAHTRIKWNADGAAAENTCPTTGSGSLSRGYLDPFHYHLGLANAPDFRATTVKFDNFSLAHFAHINVLSDEHEWNTTGQAGDSRRYEHGLLEITSGNRSLLSATNVHWIQNVSYPGPAGPAADDALDIAGYFVGELVENSTETEWLGILDPYRMGYVLGILTAASFGPACQSTWNAWLTLRSFPDPKSAFVETGVGTFAEEEKNGSLGGKTGVYKGSKESEIAAAQDLASVGRAGVTTSVSAAVGSAVASAAVAVVAPGAVAIPPGQAVSRLVRTAAFVAKVNEVPGFHTDAMAEFGESLSVFLGKFDSPFGGGGSEMAESGRQEGEEEEEGEGEGEEDGDMISDEEFTGCAFYTSVVVFGFLLIHLVIWLVTRKKALKDQLPAHAWMIYLFSIVMSYVFTAAVLNSGQYMRSHLGSGTGKGWFYVISFVHLLLIGGGFTIFFLTIMYVAHRRVQRREVKWVPRGEMADPEARRGAMVMGEYEAEDGNAFHTLFECYYTSLSGPRLWIAGIEMCVILLDAIVTAVVWNEVVCLAVLVCMYALLFTIFLTLAPFVDKVEGYLVVLLGFVELLMLVVEFLGAVGDFEMAERMEFAGLVLGFLAIGVAVVMALYGDVIPTMMSLWGMLRRRLWKKGERGDEEEEEESVGSEWSGLSSEVSEGCGSRESILEY